mgnify:CR=1 FL=1
MDYNKIQPIIDLHTCLQGEGKLVGVPHILIRTSGCPLRCTFKDTICDTPYSSYRPENGKYSLNDIKSFVEQYPQIKYVMITGGEPTMHDQLLIELCRILKSYDLYITLETAGTYKTNAVVDLISLSPKMSNSTPKLSPSITQDTIDRHEKYRKNYKTMLHYINQYTDYQLKCVVSTPEDIREILELQTILNVPNNKVYLMPEGIEADQITSKHLWLIEYCINYGYNLCDKLHVRYFGSKRDA